MPKPSKLHSKGKPSSIQKVCNSSVGGLNEVDPEESARQFQLELCWCIQQLERMLHEKKGTEKQLQEAWKILAVLKNNNQPIIRKRQLMRTHFGDYRAKMAAEEKKLVKMANKIKITDTPAQPKATFLRKSAFLTSGNNSFRFDFKLAPDQIDNGNPKLVDDKTNDTNTHEGVSSTTLVDSNKSFKFSFSNTEFRFNFQPDHL